MVILPLGRSVEQLIREETLGEWLNLDRLLVQFLESGPVRPQVMRVAAWYGAWYPRDCVRRLLPEMTKRGMVSEVE